ncbi:MAG: hypothetical protein Q8P26_00565 [Candidatus Levybacteria bacterium]|nr:hypothetical protein [Candidatus Levybacteria bacterium]
MKQSGLSSGNRKLLVGILFIVLLLWGPINPYGIIFRIAYLILLPTLLWLSLRHFGRKWDGGKSANDRLTRGILGIIAGVLFVGAYLSFTATYHSECTQSARAGDGGYECVGDYISVPGPNKVGGVMSVAFGIIAAWYAISKRDDNSS